MYRSALMENRAPAILVLDFDGTIALTDVGNEICERFAPPSWTAINERYLNGELALNEAQHQMWSLVRANAKEVSKLLETVILRPGLERLLARATTHGVPVIVASGGFRWYVERLLRPWLSQIDSIYANELVFLPHRLIQPTFPHLSRLSCHRCAICKAKLLARLRKQYSSVSTMIFVGDGASDYCAAQSADTLYVVCGSSLHMHAQQLGLSHIAFESFDSVVVA